MREHEVLDRVYNMLIPARQLLRDLVRDNGERKGSINNIFMDVEHALGLLEDYLEDSDD